MEKRIYNGDLHDVFRAPSYKFLAVASCGIHRDCRHITVRERGRADWHLLYVESGSMRVMWQESRVTLEEGGFVLYPPNVPQWYEQIGGVCYWVHFSGTAVPEIVADAGLKRYGALARSGVSHGVIRVFDRMIYHYSVNIRLRELALAADLAALLTEVGRCVSYSENLAGERLRGVIIDMQKRCPEAASTDTYAAMLGVSNGRFLHLFKDATGMSPGAYMMQLRLAKAADELLASDRTVAEIAYEVGFRDPLYFSRRFKQQYGISPEHFRQKQGTVALKRGASHTGCD